MPRPLKFGRAKQSSEGRQTNEPYAGFLAPIAFTGALRTPPVQIPSTTGSGGSHLPPCPSLSRAVPQEAVEFSSTAVASPSSTGALVPGAVELPRTLEIGGFLYQRVDTSFSGDVTMTPNNHPGSSASMHSLRENRDRLPHLDAEQHNELPDPVLRREPETTQPFTTGSSQPARLERKRKSKMLRELEAHNKSPEPSSDSDQEELFVRTERSSQSAPLDPKRKSKMLREIEAHNQSPEPESQPGVATLHDLGNDWGDLSLTRGARKDLESFLNDKPPTARKNLNLKKLMLEEFSGMEKGTKRFYAEDLSELGLLSYRRQQKCMNAMDEEEGEEEDLIQNVRTNGRSHPQPMPVRREMRPKVRKSVRKSQRVQDSAAELVWPTRDEQKDRICELLESPRYNPHPSQHEMNAQGRKKPAYHVTAEVSQSLRGAFHMDAGLYVFTPTLDNFSNFGAFLKDVEEIAGREMGVVKVIVPSEFLSRTPYPVGTELRRSRVIDTTKVNISLNENATEEPSKVYNISTTDASTSFGSDLWLHTIQSDKDRIIDKRPISAKAIDRDEVWKESHVLKPYSETRMIRHGLKQDAVVVCALNQPATSNLRAALQCKEPHLFDLLGNRFASSRSTEASINEPVFHIAGGHGPMFPLHMNKYAGYSLNYHHSGASRIITVTMPKHYAKLEEFMAIAQNGGTVLGRPWNAPKCSQFVQHQPMYVPHATLTFNGVEYTEVVQHQGEMVIIFPYAYHQAYACGPNITEEVLYASDRCKVFHREKLYHHCNSNCAGGQPDDFDLKLVFSNTLSTPHRTRSILQFPLNSTSPGQSRDASTSQTDEADNCLPKRLPGLKNLDRISDDGEWRPPAQGSGQQSSPRRKSTRLTSNPHEPDNEPDMWDPDSAYEPIYGRANNDEDTASGGDTPRRRRSGRKRGKGSGRTPRKHRGNR